MLYSNWPKLNKLYINWPKVNILYIIRSKVNLLYSNKPTCNKIYNVGLIVIFILKNNLFLNVIKNYKHQHFSLKLYT